MRTPLKPTRIALPLAAAVLATASAACGSRHAAAYRVTAVSRTRIAVDSTLDRAVPADVSAYVAPFSRAADSAMCPVVGHTAQRLWAGQPESPLSNLMADVLVWAGERYGERPALAVYNMGGIRAALPAGEVTNGHLSAAAPFRNRISFLTLTGEALNELFAQIAANGGEGVSRGVRLTVTADRHLVEATLHGQPIDPAARYRVATIEYLTGGNDHLKAFLKKTDCRIPDGPENTFLGILTDYFRRQEAEGRCVDARVEGRITLQKNAKP